MTSELPDDEDVGDFVDGITTVVSVGRFLHLWPTRGVYFELFGQSPIARFMLPHGRMRSDPRLSETYVQSQIHLYHQLLRITDKVLRVFNESKVLVASPRVRSARAHRRLLYATQCRKLHGPANYLQIKPVPTSAKVLSTCF